MIEFTQIGWFEPASKRFCYTDEKVGFAPRRSDYTHPVFSIDPDTAKRLSVNIEAQKQSAAPPNSVSRQFPTFEKFNEWYYDKSMAHEISDYFYFFTGNWPA